MSKRNIKGGFLMKTKLTEMLGIERPIIMGAMAWYTDSKMVSAII